MSIQQRVRQYLYNHIDPEAHYTRVQERYSNEHAVCVLCLTYWLPIIRRAIENRWSSRPCWITTSMYSTPTKIIEISSTTNNLYRSTQVWKTLTYYVVQFIRQVKTVPDIYNNDK